MKIAILDDYQDTVRKLACFHLLSGHEVKIFNNSVKGPGQLAARIGDAQALVLIRERTPVGKDLLSKLPNLRLIAQTGRAGPHIDLEACTERGVAVAEGVGSPIAPAELTWALIMAAMRRIPQYVSNLKHGVWQQSALKSANSPPNHGLGEVLHGKTLGIWGYGRIGRIIAGFGVAFGMNVLVWGSDASRKLAREHRLEVAATKEDLFVRSDIVTIHLRLGDATRGIVKLGDLQTMKQTALLVNTSRAELIEPGALSTALNSGHPGMAAVDVFETEPPLSGQPLLHMDNVICTPHLGYVEKSSYELYFSCAFQNILAFAAGDPQNIVNPLALQAKKH